MVSRTLYAAATLAAIGGIATAQTCNTATATATYAGHRQVAKEVVVKKEVIVPVIAPVAVYAVTPAYAAVYVPPVVPLAPAATPTPAPQATPQPSSELTQILNAINGVNSKVDSIDARLKAVEAKGGGAATPPPDKPDPFAPKPQALAKPTPATAMLALVGAKCASCHDAKTSGEKGGGLTLVENGALAKLDDRQMRKTMSLAYSGRMPPKSSNVPALTDDEVGVVAAWIDSQK